MGLSEEARVTIRNLRLDHDTLAAWRDGAVRAFADTLAGLPDAELRTLIDKLDGALEVLPEFSFVLAQEAGFHLARRQEERSGGGF